MKSTTASLIITALASTAIAQPHGHHQHQHPARAAHQHHHKRDLVTQWDTVWVTETVTELVDGTTTEWITPTHSPETPSTTLATSTSSAGGQFFEGSSALPSSAPQVVAPPPAAETPSSPPAVVAPAPAPTTSSSSSSVYVAPQPTVEAPSPAPVAPQVETPAAPSVAAVNTPAASPDTGSSSGSTVDTNTNAASFLGSGYLTGDLTYYAVGLGACGEDDSGKDMTDNIVAMSAETMGSQSNGNPMCGKTIKIYNNANGKHSTGTIRDKCPGCKQGSIDVSQKLFEELADLADGRIDISWNWAS
ncbi:allergen Asp F7 [Diaporthe sp. PMI_573]|nr:allergen Asp F7 [Diaporthaceae sp. PMI_573]